MTSGPREAELKQLPDDFRIWEGVFPTFDAAAPVGPGFSGATHRTRAIAAAREAIDAVRGRRPIPRFLSQRIVMLPAVVATARVKTGARLRVLDFGGGLGIGYLVLLQTIPGIAERLDYHIVDIEEVCEAGRSLFAGDSGVVFHDRLPDDKGFDVLFSASAIQYVEPWQEVLGLLLAYRAPQVLLSDLFAGDIPTFCTLQNYYGSKIPQWFFNVAEVESVARKAGYRVGMSMLGSMKRLDRESGLAMDGFPPSHRIPETLHLLLQPE